MQGLTVLEATGRTELELLTSTQEERTKIKAILQDKNFNNSVLIVDAVFNRQFAIVQTLLGIEAMNRSHGYMTTEMQEFRRFLKQQIDNGTNNHG